ncbi:MAG: hypothetical protein AUJ32_02870 [Parcubacteria group bacterium CG1_02_40_82]|uniref:Uncharacterized protein n=4 Tax=Candidatus Portnoyibacteriota TaxID=1817913 RepID=A0A2M7IJH6_9BACT|nr:MAG: hypothetical protein AUJ32_02870 [Parcubacteria group bacterium CG1_02_40_82]PIQ74858.1 MAG: hypothetical protein COV84_04300 [Candidatus Portnoybacteria bacterium CG11_big_fil_rev_8_21_14_0_20_40_15]PIS31594.1 MAG: hypothetical protein COT41_01285 [Candidatus Portnoybacteria bacterium CG08_land_8_20_14_0_20_40_83]PIW76608.1 MAG: hypothetical protein CO001_00410 [Candidatus Portnoybacteria bacterium CG_4_8_14_3_um_filter_40_10]PIY75430.1 MAG: hypothetical protein COY85_00185 [Candidatus
MTKTPSQEFAKIASSWDGVLLFPPSLKLRKDKPAVPPKLTVYTTNGPLCAPLTLAAYESLAPLDARSAI